MTTDDRVALRQQLVLHEGWRLKPYTDSVGKITIGVGRNLTDRGISPLESEALLDHDIDRVLHELSHAYAWFETLNGVRQRVLADMCFNLGFSRLSQFTETLHSIQRQDFTVAAQSMLQSKWAGQVGARAQRLAAMMLSGEDYSA